MPRPRREAGCRRPEPAPRDVDVRDDRHAEENQQAETRDAELQVGVDAQRMLARRDVSRQQQAAEAHAAHERPQQHAQRDSRRADDELEELEPDDFVDQGGAAAADKQQQQRGHVASRGHQTHLFMMGIRRACMRITASKRGKRDASGMSGRRSGATCGHAHRRCAGPVDSVLADGRPVIVACWWRRTACAHRRGAVRAVAGGGSSPSATCTGPSSRSSTSSRRRA